MTHHHHGGRPSRKKTPGRGLVGGKMEEWNAPGGGWTILGEGNKKNILFVVK